MVRASLSLYINIHKMHTSAKTSPGNLYQRPARKHNGLGCLLGARCAETETHIITPTNTHRRTGHIAIVNAVVVEVHQSEHRHVAIHTRFLCGLVPREALYNVFM